LRILAVIEPEIQQHPFSKAKCPLTGLETMIKAM
jgi:hypothetical protein